MKISGWSIVRRDLSKTEVDWKKELYTNLNIDYPKFYKMDPLAKMAFICFQELKEKVDFDSYSDEDIALIFVNSTASKATDQLFIDSYSDGKSPSPSLFVYTLPNILTGELAILNKWYGENIFFIEEKFNPELYIDQINSYFSKGAKACLCGWVDADKNKEECILFLVEKGEENIREQLVELYNKKS